MNGTAMDLQALSNELNRLLTTESRGLARHLGEATPYLTAATYPLWHEMQLMLGASTDHAQRISSLLFALDLPERLFPFDAVIAGFHYTDLAYLLPVLIDEKRAQGAAYQRAIGHCGTDLQAMDTASELQALLDENQAQLDRMEVQHRSIAGATA